MNSQGEVVIRHAVPGDIEAILALDRGIASLPHWAAPDYRAAIAGGGSGQSRSLFVAEVEGTIQGLAAAVVHSVGDACWAELETVGVAMAMQRRGLGRELCRSVIGWCQSHRPAYIDLEVRSRGAGPIALYRELGFEIAGKRRGYYRNPADDALQMRLDLKRAPALPVKTTT